MQHINDYGLMGIAPTAPTQKLARTPLSLDDALDIASIAAAATRTNPTPGRKRGRRTTTNTGSGNTITEARARAHDNGTQPLPEGSWIITDARGQVQGRIDIGEGWCRRAVTDIRIKRADMVYGATASVENRPHKARR